MKRRSDIARSLPHVGNVEKTSQSLTQIIRQLNTRVRTDGKPPDILHSDILQYHLITNMFLRKKLHTQWYTTT